MTQTPAADIVERLRLQMVTNPRGFEYGQPFNVPNAVCTEAATEIEALRAREAELQRKLDEAVGALEKCDREVSHGMLGDWSIALREIRKTACAALSSIRGEG